ncbi:E3 SUMO-protein ligase SIZ1 [Linum grandiflorum]
MDLVNSCKEKLVYFRIKELKDVLTQLGLSKQGKKQDLVDRILSVLSDDQASNVWPKRGAFGKEEAAKLVDDVYRKMQVSGTDLASKGQSTSNSSSAKLKGEPEDSFHCDRKVRCPCGSTLETKSMIKCEEPRCEVWQHIGCVIVAEKPMEGSPLVPEVFYCEICRLNRADPTNPVQSVEKSFHLTRADKDLLAKPDMDVQAWCMLLNDKVLFRMQWPQYADLQVNGVAIRAINRPGSQLLGANGRDDGPIITPCSKDGINKISLTGCDARTFCLGVRIVKRRTLQQILGLIPKEADGERFDDALARVCRCVGGGPATDDADSDSDLEVVADSISVNLRCPWQCPICLKNYSLEDVIIDPYFNRITTKMRNFGEDITELEVKPDASWRVKTRTEAERREVGQLSQWHNADGTPCVPKDEFQTKAETGKQIKQEGISEGHGANGLKLRIKKNYSAYLQGSKPEDMDASSSDNRLLKVETLDQKVIPRSSSATASGRAGEDPSVNQDGGGNFNFTNGGMEHDSLARNSVPACGFIDRTSSAPVGEPDIIVLSDTDDDDDILVSSGTGFNNNSGVPESCPQNPNLSAAVNSGWDNDEFGIPIWPLQGGPGFQLFNSEVSDPLVDLQHGTSSMNGYSLAPQTDLVPRSTLGRSDVNGGLVDNPLSAFEEDPSLQLFLPTRPSDSSTHSNLRDQVDVSNGVPSEDWISLTLGGNGSGESADANGLNSRQSIPNRDNGTMDSVANTASSLTGTNEKKPFLVGNFESEKSPW